MRHARPPALDELEDVLAAVRAAGVLNEKSRGCFYRGSKSFLHFHEDPEGLFADLKGDTGFDRFRVSTAKERAAFLKEARARLKG